jgi:hypothetical protein
MQDVRFAVRALRAARIVTTVCSVAGARDWRQPAILSIGDALLLRPLPARDPSWLVLSRRARR